MVVEVGVGAVQSCDCTNGYEETAKAAAGFGGEISCGFGGAKRGWERRSEAMGDTTGTGGIRDSEVGSGGWSSRD